MTFPGNWWFCLPFSQCSSLFGTVLDRPDGAFARRGHEPDDGQEGCSDGPRRLPRFGVMARNGQTNLFSLLKPAVGRHDDDVGRFHGVIRRQQDSSVINSAFEVGVGWPAHGEVPLEEILLQGLCEVVDGGLGQLLGLPHQAFDGRRSPVVLRLHFNTQDKVLHSLTTYVQLTN